MAEFPSLPIEISNDGREVWDWAHKLSERVQLIDKLKRLRGQAHTVRNTCGSCTAWMTRDCPKEVHDNRSGRYNGPSSGATKCSRFSMSNTYSKMIERIDSEILSVELQLKNTSPSGGERNP